MKYRILYFTFFYYFDVSTPCFINTVKTGVCGPPKGRTIVAEFQVFRSVRFTKLREKWEMMCCLFADIINKYQMS